MNRRIVLAQRPHGRIDQSTTRVEEVDVPAIGEGEALIKVGLVSIDPTIRGWMNDAPGYLPPIGIGEVIRSVGAGVVTESRRSDLKVGDVVLGLTGWQEWCRADALNAFSVIPPGTGLDLPTVLNSVGLTGLTAYFGLLEVGAFKAGDSVLVSGATGATGSVVGQLAKKMGAKRVVGIAGGPEKCREATEIYGYDLCLDYKAPDLSGRIAAALPEGVDVYFDNVGGEILDTALLHLAMHGRVVACGAISTYNDATPGESHGLKNTFMFIIRRGRMEGFIVSDFIARWAEAQLELAGLVLSGELAHREHLIAGLERAPEALNMLFDGTNHGKTIVVVDDSVRLG